MIILVYIAIISSVKKNQRKHMKKLKLVSSITLSALIFTACSAGSPKPSVNGEKPTLFIESHTANKFKDITEENADANGISSAFVKDKQYLRCDILPEVIVTFTKEGFSVIHDKKKADYTVDLSLLSCGQGREYYEFRNANPPKSKDFYKRNIELAHEYLQRTNNVVMPNKYYGIPEEDKKILESYFKETQIKSNDTNVVTSGVISGMGYIGNTAGALGTLGGGSAPTGAKALGGFGLAMGIISLTGGVRNPDVYNEFKITKNSSGKSWSKTVNLLTFTPQDWKININKPIYDWTIDEIPWNELD